MLQIHEARIPGAQNPIDWVSVCHSRDPFIWISFSQYRDTGRWVHVERTRKFEVTCFHRSRTGISSFTVGFYKTIESARAAARKFAAERAALEA